MFCSAWISSSNENENSTARQAKLTKLIKLWQDKSIFDPSTLTKMQHVEETWEECKNKKLDEYQQQISLATKHLKDTYQNYSNNIKNTNYCNKLVKTQNNKNPFFNNE